MNTIVIADYDYSAEDDTQLTFDEGDRIVVLEKDSSGWWSGRLEKNGQEGYFPSTYIKGIEEEEEEEEEEYTKLQERNEENDNENNGKTKLINNKKYQMQKNKSTSEFSENKSENKLENKLEETDIKIEVNNKKNENAESKEGNQTTTSPDIDYNNYFANAQKVMSVADNFDGEEGNALIENYYSAEVLNLKFNPNAKTRYGLASHYMSMFASISTIFLGTSAFAWSNGSDWLLTQNLANYDICLLIGLYSFFGGFIMLIWEYLRGDTRLKRSIPFRSIGYFCFGIPLFITLPTSLNGVLWINTTVMSILSFKNKETYKRKIKKSYSDEKILSPKEQLLSIFNCTSIRTNIELKCIEIRQQSKIKKYIFIILYLLGNFIYIIYWASFYSNMVIEINKAANNGENFGNFTIEQLSLISNRNTSPGDSPIILSGWFAMAKMFGNLLDINCAFILLPVCRSFISQLYNISTDQRNIAKTCNYLLSFMPLDKALQFHKLCAFLIVIGTIFHTWSHFNHFADVPSTYEEVFGATVWITGGIIIICMHFLYCSSFASVRHGKFELFWYTHHLFIIFFLSILFHGANSINPNFWKWFLIPGILYIIERTLREIRARKSVGVVSIVHMNNKNARIFCLELEKENISHIKNHQEGQYVFIKAPIISKIQWHPFTISSPPDKKTLTLHIRNMGDGSWTDRLQQFFQAIAPGKAYSELYHRDGDILIPQTIGPDGNNLICIDGPYSAPTQRLGEYATSIIIGAGIGVTPVRAVLQSIVYFRFKRGIGRSFPDSAYCVWIVNYKQLDAYKFMCRSLKEAEDELYNMRKKNPKQMEKKLLQMHIFVTSTPKTEKEYKKYTDTLNDIQNINKNDRQKDLSVWGTHYNDEIYDNDNLSNQQRITAPFNEFDIWKCLKKPSDQPTQIGDIIIHKGRPKWDQFFQPIQQAHRGNKIGVMFCGPDIIAKDLKKACGKFTDFDTKTVFLLHKENF